MGNVISSGATAANTAGKGQVAQGLQLQNYCNSVMQQPALNLSGFSSLKDISATINKDLSTAQFNCKYYLNTIQPMIITNISNIQNYFQLNQVIPIALPPGSTTAEWINMLCSIRDQADQYQAAASNVVSELSSFRDRISIDSANFLTDVQTLNTLVKGDNGVLASINGQLSSIDKKVDACIAGIALSGLAIVGGAFLTAVGAIADFVTAGTSTPLVIGGVVILAAGIAGEAASAVTLANLNNTKAGLLKQQSQLNAEVNLATGISQAVGSLQSQAAASVQSATQMAAAWSFLSSDLVSLSSDLQKGIISVGDIRKLFLLAAQNEIQTVLNDTNIIKQQMSGVRNLVAPANVSISDFTLQLVKQAA